MQKRNILILFILFLKSVSICAQKKTITYLGASYTIETNVGFYGTTIEIEEEIKIRPKLAAVVSANYFHSNKVPDHKIGGEYNHSFMTDICLQLNSKKDSKGFYANIGPTLKISNTKQIAQFATTSSGVVYNLLYIKRNEKRVGLKFGIGYKIPLYKSIHSAIFIDCRVIDNLPEPTFLGLGYKIGF